MSDQLDKVSKQRHTDTDVTYVMSLSIGYVVKKYRTLWSILRFEWTNTSSWYVRAYVAVIDVGVDVLEVIYANEV